MVSVTHEEAKIIIADDHELTRESIRKMLESEPHLQVLAEAKDGQEVIELCRLQHPDLVLMDVGMPKVNGFEATQTIKAELPTTKVLMLSAHFDSFFASEVDRTGADGYVTNLLHCTGASGCYTGSASRRVSLPFSFRELSMPEVRFPRRSLLSSSVNRGPAQVRDHVLFTTGYCISRLFRSVIQQLVVFATFSYHRARKFGYVVEAKNSVP